MGCKKHVETTRETCVRLAKDMMESEAKQQPGFKSIVACNLNDSAPDYGWRGEVIYRGIDSYGAPAVITNRYLFGMNDNKFTMHAD